MSQPLLITVNSPKGGVGKTTISKELAGIFSLSKSRLKVCLVDLDVDFGDVAPILKLKPYPNISHWIAEVMHKLKDMSPKDIRYSEQQIKSYMIPYSDTLDILAAPKEYISSIDFSSHAVNVIIDNLLNCDYDIIIFDTGNNTKDATLTAIERSDITLVVVTFEINSVRNAKMVIDTLREIDFPIDRFKLIINRVAKFDKNANTSEINEVLNLPTIAMIPEFDKVRYLNNQGEFITESAKHSEFAQAMKELAKKLYPGIAV